MLNAIESFQSNLRRLKSAIDKEDEAALIKILNKAKDKRETLR
jgi:prephenate dehydrogenase